MLWKLIPHQRHPATIYNITYQHKSFYLVASIPKPKWKAADTTRGRKVHQLLSTLCMSNKYWGMKPRLPMALPGRSWVRLLDDDRIWKGLRVLLKIRVQDVVTWELHWTTTTATGFWPLQSIVTRRICHSHTHIPTVTNNVSKELILNTRQYFFGSTYKKENVTCPTSIQRKYFQILILPRRVCSQCGAAILDHRPEKTGKMRTDCSSRKIKYKNI